MASLLIPVNIRIGYSYPAEDFDYSSLSKSTRKYRQDLVENVASRLRKEGWRFENSAESTEDPKTITFKYCDINRNTLYVAYTFIVQQTPGLGNAAVFSNFEINGRSYISNIAAAVSIVETAQNFIGYFKESEYYESINELDKP